MRLPDPTHYPDLRALWLSVRKPLLYWFIAVVIICLIGYPGVVCLTPGAWLIGIPAGTRVARFSRRPRPYGVLGDGALAGVIIAFIQGLVFIAVILIAGNNFLPQERISLAMTGAVLIGLGSLVCGAITTLSTLSELAHQAEKNNPSLTGFGDRS